MEPDDVGEQRMTDELSTDQRLIRRGRHITAAAVYAFLAVLAGLFVYAIVTENISDRTLLLTMVAVMAVGLVAELMWAVWLLLGGTHGAAASAERVHEAVYVLLSVCSAGLMVAVFSAYWWVRPGHLGGLAIVVLALLLVGAGVLTRARDVVRRRYPTLPKDRPSWRRQEPVASWAGWYPDPDDRRVMRYFDGAGWTDAVYDPGAPVR
jgi:hypothetical protein